MYRNNLRHLLRQKLTLHEICELGVIVFISHLQTHCFRRRQFASPRIINRTNMCNLINIQKRNQAGGICSQNRAMKQIRWCTLCKFRSFSLVNFSRAKASSIAEELKLEATQNHHAPLSTHTLSLTALETDSKVHSYLANQTTNGMSRIAIFLSVQIADMVRIKNAFREDRQGTLFLVK